LSRQRSGRRIDILPAGDGRGLQTYPDEDGLIGINIPKNHNRLLVSSNGHPPHLLSTWYPPWICREAAKKISSKLIFTQEAPGMEMAWLSAPAPSDRSASGTGQILT
jgi:hypothetical protein